MDVDLPAITLTDPHNQDALPQSPIKSPASSTAALAQKQVTNPGSPGALSRSDSPSSSTGWQSSLFHSRGNYAHVRTTSSVGTEAPESHDIQHESQTHIDPLSQHIMRRTNATPNTSNARPNTADDTAARDDRKRSAEGREATPVQDPQALSRVDTEETTAHRDLKKGVKAVAFLSRLIGSNKRRDPEDDTKSETASIAERPEGNNAQIFTDSVDNLGFSPRHPQPPAYIKVRARNKRKAEFDHLFLAQELDARRPKLERQNSSNKLRRKSSGPSEANTIWALEFSKDGKYLAAAGADMIVRVWAVLSSPEDRHRHEHQESSANMAGGDQAHAEHLSAPVFQNAPIREYEGHSQTVLDLSWSKNNFLLSSSMDKTVRLWHVSRAECLCTFKHNDFVPSIAFHPKDDRFFLAGSLDSKLRLWSIPDKSVAYSAQIGDMITAVAFTPDGKYAAAGCLGGLCVFYETDGFKYQTRIHVRSTRGQNAKGSKITGIQSFTAADGSVKLLISSNDSRIRLYNFKDQSLQVKLKGNENLHSQIRGMLSDDARYVVCGSEDRKAFIWSLQGEDQERRDKRPVEFFEANDSMTTAACFAPAKTKMLLSKSEDPVYDICNPPPVTLTSRGTRADSPSSSRPRSDSGSVQQTPRMAPLTATTDTSARSPAYVSRSAHQEGGIIVTADYFGKIKVFRQDCAWNKRKPEIEWDRSSMFTKPNGAGKLSRTGSTATRASQKSVKEGRNSTSTQPSSERILSWRQGITSNSSIAESSRGGSSKATSRSISPQKSLEVRTKNVNVDASKTGPDSAGTTRSTHPLAVEAMTASPPPPETPRRARGETMASTMSPGSDAYADAREEEADNHNPLDIVGGQSYVYWDTEIWKKRRQEQAERQQQAEAGAQLRPVSEQDDHHFLRPTVTRASRSYVSELSDERSTDTENEHYDDALESQMKCRACGSRFFSARRKRGRAELACTGCGTLA